MLSRVLYGTRPLAIVVSLSVALGATVGSLYGMLAGAVGGLVELLLMRLVDIMLSIPAIVIAVLLAVSYTHLDVYKRQQFALVDEMGRYGVAETMQRRILDPAARPRRRNLWVSASAVM